MLPSTNKTISILRLAGSNTRTYTTVATGIEVYINQTREDVVGGFENMPTALTYRMFTDGTHTAIAVGDQVNDGTNTYQVVTPAAVSDDLTGIHHQYLLIIAQS